MERGDQSDPAHRLDLSEKGTAAEKSTNATKDQKKSTPARPKRVGRAFALLTTTYQGSDLPRPEKTGKSVMVKATFW